MTNVRLKSDVLISPIIWPNTSSSHDTRYQMNSFFGRQILIERAKLFSELNLQSQILAGFRRWRYQPGLAQKQAIVFPLLLPLPRCTRFRSLHFMWLNTYPTLSHLQQQQQQTKRATMMTPASTDMVMIKTWKLTVSQKKVKKFT